MEINSLYFDDLKVENEFRHLLQQMFNEDYIMDLINDEINFIPMDEDDVSSVDLPAVFFRLYQYKPKSPDNEQIQRYTPFAVQIDVYTSGKGKVLKNKELCNYIIRLLQSNGPLIDYYNQGLMIEENRETNTLIDSAYRRTIRMTGLCDNSLKLISKEK